MLGHVLRDNGGLHHTTIEGAFEGRKSPWRRKYLYIVQLRKDAGIDIYAGLKRLVEDR